MITIKLALKNQIIELTIDEARQLRKELTEVIGDSQFPTLNRDINSSYGPLSNNKLGIIT